MGSAVHLLVPLALLAAAAPTAVAAAAQQQPQAQTQAQQPACGAVGAPCGRSLPAGSPCAASPGFCAAGAYCARCSKGSPGCEDDRSLCRPLPKACGTKAVADPDNTPFPGDPSTFCCPPNAYKPLSAAPNATTEWLMPSCRDGRTCKYGTQGPWRNHPDDPYAANLGSNEFFGHCLDTKQLAGCGWPGKPCCPNPYHTGFNPPLPAFLCWGSRDFSNSSYCDMKQKLCVPNAPSCGKVGAPCCVADGGSTTNYFCVSNTEKGFYCARGSPMMCSVCPSDWQTKFEPTSWEYFSCKR